MQVGEAVSTRSGTEDRNRRWATASTAPTSAAALVTLFSITDEELCTDYRSASLTISGSGDDHSIANFGSVLRISSGTKVDSRRSENIGVCQPFSVPPNSVTCNDRRAQFRLPA